VSKGKSKLLERMRASKAGWSADDLLALYQQYGFAIRHGSSHDIVSHPQHPELRATVPRHPKELAKVYVSQAVKLVSLLEELQVGGSDGIADA
jgi:predicted RNA binding protein YcfA (HicA-like mRNA interferase family)